MTADVEILWCCVRILFATLNKN